MRWETCILWLVAVTACDAINAPVIDLGYGLWQGTLNSTGRYYNFSNIRYAQPPVGALRFAAPQPPMVNRTIINDGQDGRICPQGFPNWQKERNLFTEAYLQNPNNVSAFKDTPAPGSNVSITQAPRDNRTNEDCLFLEVLVPQSVFDSNASSKAPVLVWTYGGGFYGGDAESQGNPAGLLSRSMSNAQSSPGIVYVAINYRLGSLGWLAGPTFNASGGVANAALYDQRLALQWVQDNVGKFGGDPQRVTLAGESAGATMSLHQITAFGNKTVAPFQQVFLTSPAFSPDPYSASQEKSYQRLLSAANATSLADLQALTSEQMIEANELAIFAAPYANSGFGPVVDGVFAPQLPDALLAKGLRAQNIKALVIGHNTHEGLLFTNPSIQNTSAFNTYIRTTALPGITSAEFDVLIALYPPIFDKPATLGYNDTISRLATATGDLLVSANTNALYRSFPKTHSFLFAEGAGLHGADTPYLFNNGPAEQNFNLGPVNLTVAHALQDFMVRFVATGSPNPPGGGAPSLPLYGANRTMGLISNQGIGVRVTDPTSQKREDFWESGSFYNHSTQAVF